MGKIIRRTATVTITITETWTIVWSTEDDPLHFTINVVQANSKTQEEPDETQQSALMAGDPANPCASNSTATPHTLAATNDHQPGDVPARSIDRSKRALLVGAPKVTLEVNETEVIQKGAFT